MKSRIRRLFAFFASVGCIFVAGSAVGQSTAKDSLRKVRDAMRAVEIDTPSNNADELSDFLVELSKSQGELASEYRKLSTKLAKAKYDAANQVLAAADAVSDEAFYEAAQIGLTGRLTSLLKADRSERDEVTELVKRQFRIGIARGLSSTDLNNASRLARYLQQAGQEASALEVYQSFSAKLAEKGDPRFKRWQSSFEAAAKKLALLGSELELEGSAIDDRIFDWPEYRGKVVLVDFWATWCGPCIAEAPNVRRCYDAYRHLGFDVVGISLDSDQKKLEAYLNKTETPWTNLFARGAGWKHPMAIKYGVTSIPTAILVDKDGTVVSLNARGQSLRKQLEQLLGKPTIPSDWPSVVEAAKQRLADEPDDTKRITELAIAQARAQLWDDCVETFRSLYEKQKNSNEVALSLASALLLAGAQEEYQALCKEFKARLDDSPSARTLYLYSRSLASEFGSKNDAAIELAKRSVELDEKTWHVHTLALSHLQAGNWDQAVSWANRSIEKDNWDGDPCDWLILAIAHYEKGEHDKAKKWLTKSTKWIEENERTLNLDEYHGLPIHPHNWLGLKLLQRKALARTKSAAN